MRTFGLEWYGCDFVFFVNLAVKANVLSYIPSSSLGLDGLRLWLDVL